MTADVMREALAQVASRVSDSNALESVRLALRKFADSNSTSEPDLQRLIPDVRRLLAGTAAQPSDLVIFLDDFHVLGIELQPRLLSALYSVTRGSNIYLKLSAIETLTRTWDPAARIGLQIAQDVQEIKLDYNLTIPEKATAHIESILDSHATYCGIPSIRTLCTSPDVLSRLVWVAAGVPRDALNLFSQAMTKATLQDRNKVSVSNVNVAASDMLNTKLRELETDAFGAAERLRPTLERIRDFCIDQQRTNAFLVEIAADDARYQEILKLVDLRLLHVINEGISIGKAGRRYVAFILDYGFYIGIRAARSVDLFNKQTRKVAHKQLRKLAVFTT